MKNKDKQEATWKPYNSRTHGRLSTTEKNAFPHTRKEPMTDATHVRDAMARFNQVKDVTDTERDLAFSNIQKAAKHFDIHMNETDWHEFGSKQ